MDSLGYTESDIMGLFDRLLGKSPAAASDEIKSAASPFRISLAFTPFRLAAMRNGSINLIVRITNTTNEKQLVSLEVLLPRKELLGFDPTAINKYTDKKIGDLQPGETKEIAITIWGTHQTKANDYSVDVTVYSHYIDYTKVINYIKKRTTLRVV